MPLLDHVLHNIPQAVFWKNRQCVYLGCNLPFAHAVGLDAPEQIVGKTDFDLPWPRKDAEAYRADDREVMDRDRPKRHIHEPLTQADGKQLWVDTTKVPLHDETGQVVGVLGVYEDITERRRSDQEFRNSQRMLQLVLDTIPVRVFWKNRDLKYLGCNRLFAADAGTSSPNDVIARSDYELGWREQADLYRADDRQVIDTGAPKINYEELQTTPEGQHIWLRTSKIPLREESGAIIGVMGTYEDITARRKAEDALAYRFSFEKLLAALSTRFINLRPEEIDEGVNDALRDIGQFMDVDRSYVFVFRDDGQRMDNTHEWCADGIDSYIDHLKDLAIADFPCASGEIRRGEVAQIRVADLGPDRRIEKAEFEREGIQSLVLVPMSCRNRILGFLGLDAVRSERIFNEDSIALLRLAGECLAGALERKRYEETLRRERDVLHQVMETSPSGIVRLDHEGRIAFANARAEQVLGLSRASITDRFYNDPGWRVTDYDGNPLPEHELPFVRVKKCGQSVREICHAIEHPDGRRVLLSINAAPLLGPNGRFDGVVATVEDVTDRVLAERKLQETTQELKRSEGRYRFYMENLRGIAYQVEVGRFRPHFFHGSVLEITGHSPTDFLEERIRWDQLIHPDDQPLVVREGQRLFHHPGSTADNEYRIVRKDGTVRWVRDIGQNVTTEPGGPTIINGLVWDVTERREAEETLRASEARMRSIFRASPVGIGLVSNRVLLQVNDRICEMTGYSENELIGQNARLLYPSQKEFDFVGLEKYRQISQTGIGTVETSWKQKDGRLIDVLMSSVPLDPGNLEAGVTFTALDITERKRAMDELTRAQALLTAAIEHSPAGILIADAPDVRIRLANAAALSIRGPSDRRLTDIPVEQHPQSWQAYRPDGKPYRAEDLPLSRAVLKGETSHNEEVIIKRNDGEQRTVLANAAPVTSPTGKLLAGIMVFPDITELKKAEEEHQRLQAQVQHVQKLESLGVLAGGIAHDFNNLLMAILGNADLAMRALSPVAPAQGYLRDIETASRRAADLCRQMLAYSGKGRFVVEALNLNEVVEEMTRMLEVSISKRALLKFNLAANLPAIEADATQVRQVLMNLITNASEAIAEKSGIISITSGAMACDRSYLDESYLSEGLTEGRYVFVEVADTGCGMTPEVRSRIFDPFFTTKFTGRGLGMAAVLGIVRGHKGAIKIYSESGRGTTIKVLFPASERTVTKASDGTPSSEEWIGSGTILIVDDEETVRVVTEHMLELMGFKAIAANDGRAALDLFRQRHAEITCILLDLTMPHMDGEEAYRELRRIDQNVRVIMSSGYNEQEVTQRFAGKGLAGFIQKPFQFEALRDKLREVLEGPNAG